MEEGSSALWFTLPEMIFKSVDLPVPLGPTTARSFEGWVVKFTDLRMVTWWMV